jgi:hypothetical protein
VRIESPTFTDREMRAFLDEFVDHERERLAERLETISARLVEIVSRGVSNPPNGQQEWTGHEVLAHMATVAKFYGVLAYQVGAGKVTATDLLTMVHMRDAATEQLGAQSDDELLAAVLRDHQRTISYLRSADAAAMNRKATLYEGFSMSAMEIATLPLCAHLELHLDQLERASNS